MELKKIKSFDVGMNGRTIIERIWWSKCEMELGIEKKLRKEWYLYEHTEWLQKRVGKWERVEDCLTVTWTGRWDPLPFFIFLFFFYKIKNEYWIRDLRGQWLGFLGGGRWSRRFQLVHADRQARRGGDGLGSRKVLDCFCFKLNDFQFFFSKNDC